MIKYWTDEIYDLSKSTYQYICKCPTSNYQGIIDFDNQTKMYFHKIQNCFKLNEIGILGEPTKNLDEAKKLDRK